MAANAAIQSVGPGMPVGAASVWKIARSTTAMTAKFARLNAILTADRRDVSSIASADPVSTATMYSFGEKKKKPTTAGISLSENECVSRRKWTTMTLASAARKPIASSGHGGWIGDSIAGRSRTIAR